MNNLILHLVKSIIFSQFLRLRRIFNNDHTFMRRSDEMSEFFSQRGFPIDTIKNSLRKASKFTQPDAINKRENMNSTGIPLAMKFSGIAQRIAKAINKTTTKHSIFQSYLQHQLHSCGMHAGKESSRLLYSFQTLP